MNIVQELTGNYILNAAIIAWFIAQFLKLIFDFATTGKLDLRRFIGGAGGMPSSHSALVVAMAITTWRVRGFQSVEFALAAVLAAVVMYDASGIRRAAGEQAKVLNIMIEQWNDPELRDRQLKELLGHTPLQVVAGAVVGALVGLLYTN